MFSRVPKGVARVYGLSRFAGPCRFARWSAMLYSARACSTRVSSASVRARRPRQLRARRPNQ
eukprot:3214828-Lingulodinium_polyedra.AAC.1